MHMNAMHDFMQIRSHNLPVKPCSITKTSEVLTHDIT